MSQKLLLLGATGLTGRQLLDQALEQGHVVTALVRDPSKLAGGRDHLRLLEGSSTDPTVAGEAVDGQDAVLCALGTRSPASLLGCDLMRASMRALVPAMERGEVRRLILLSALGVGESAGSAPPAFRLTFATLLREVGRDKAAAEELVRGSDLDWTIVYPPSLTEGPITRSYRFGESLDLTGVPKISRADVAHLMLSLLGEPGFFRKAAVVAPG